MPICSWPEIAEVISADPEIDYDTEILCEPLLKNSACLITLNEGQRAALLAMLEWRQNGQSGGLRGFAGTGKTAVLAAFIIELMLRGEIEGVRLATPTHEAANVLNGKIGGDYLNVREFCEQEGVYLDKLPEMLPVVATTIHSLLGLRPEEGKTKKEDARLVRSKSSKLKEGDYLIIDECSMVSDDLLGFINQDLASCKAAVLYSGDDKQLRPVGAKDISRTFRVEPFVQLTEPARHTGPVFEQATAIREGLACMYPAVVTNQGAIENGVREEVSTFLNKQRLIAHWMDHVEAAYHNPKEVEEAVMLCWTNRERMELNKRMRQRLFGDHAPDYEPDECLRMLAPYRPDENSPTVIQGNTKVLIKEAREGVSHCAVPDLDLSYRCWWLRVAIDKETCKDIYVVHWRDRKKYEHDLKELNDSTSAAVELARKHVKAASDEEDRLAQLAEEAEEHTFVEATEEAEKAAIKARAKVAEAHLRYRCALAELAEAETTRKEHYVRLREAFAQVDYLYAMTVHKSQGSGFPVVYVNTDIMRLKSYPEAKELLYVAVTRAKRIVHHVLVPKPVHRSQLGAYQ